MDFLAVMDNSQRVWASTFFIVYLSCFRRAGEQYPTSLLMLVVVVVTVVMLMFCRVQRRAKNQARGHKSKNNTCQKGSRGLMPFVQTLR